ncbi:MAG TPA: F0F1 ATP synthase subunit epsilon [bacterium]|nr:F0F1 ATP synthase subunit epsilon [bacterium]
MADTLSVKLVTPTRKLYEAEATNIIAPGANGEFGIMTGHDPWMVALGMGPLKIQNTNGELEQFFTNGGFCQIDEDKVVILAEVCEASIHIDVTRAENAKKRAEERIAASPKDDSIDLLRAEAALRRALYRLDIAGD